MPDYICEICGQPATGMHQDLVPGDPVQDDQGTWWVTQKPGPVHYTCEAHATDLLTDIPAVIRPFVAHLIRQRIQKEL